MHHDLINLGKGDSLEVKGISSPMIVTTSGVKMRLNVNFDKGIIMSLEKYYKDMDKIRGVTLIEVSKKLRATGLILLDPDEDNEMEEE